MHSSAFSQPATGPSSVCEGSNVTLQCRVVFNDFPRDSVWYRNGTPVEVNNNDFIPNHNVITNSTTGALTDLMITDVTLEDDNTLYTCTATGDSINSSVVLNVSGKHVHVNVHLCVNKCILIAACILIFPSIVSNTITCNYLFVIISYITKYIHITSSCIHMWVYIAYNVPI